MQCGLKIRTHHLKQPQSVAFNQNSNSGNIYYHYDATGNKLAQTLASSDNSDYKVTEYLGNLIYTNGNLSTIITEEGRLVPNGNGSYRYEYNLKDHLGNTRATFAGTDYGGTDLIQTTSYYPFGLVMKQQNFNLPSSNYEKNNYLYNGKELQDEGFDGVELGWLDYGARMYDPAIGRTTTLDPHAENYYSESSYSFMGNNPINNVDPTGMDWYQSADGSATIWRDNQDKEMSINDEEYSNIGENYSMQIGRNDYLNFYQNAEVSTSTGGATNAKQTILGSDKLMADYLGKDSPLSDTYKSELFNTKITSTTDDAAKAVFVSAMITAGALGVASIPAATLTDIGTGIAAGAKATLDATITGAAATYNFGNAAVMTVEGSSALSVVGGIADGLIKSSDRVAAPLDMPYLFMNPLFQISSDAVSSGRYFYQQYKSNRK